MTLWMLTIHSLVSHVSNMFPSLINSDVGGEETEESRPSATREEIQNPLQPKMGGNKATLCDDLVAIVQNRTRTTCETIRE